MTGDNRRRNVADELARSEQALRAAEALVGLGLCADAVSRAYDGAYHVLARAFDRAARELLEREGYLG